MNWFDEKYLWRERIYRFSKLWHCTSSYCWKFVKSISLNLLLNREARPGHNVLLKRMLSLFSFHALNAIFSVQLLAGLWKSEKVQGVDSTVDFGVSSIHLSRWLTFHKLILFYSSNTIIKFSFSLVTKVFYAIL